MGDEGHLSTKSCTTTGLLKKCILEKHFMSNTTRALRARTENETSQGMFLPPFYLQSVNKPKYIFGYLLEAGIFGKS